MERLDRRSIEGYVRGLLINCGFDEKDLIYGIALLCRFIAKNKKEFFLTSQNLRASLLIVMKIANN